MTLKTVSVLGTLYDPDGAPAAGARIVAKISAYETDNGVVVPEFVQENANGDGSFVLQLWPNQRGTRGTKYLVDVYHGIRKLLSTSIVVPDVDYAIQFDDIINAAPFPPVDASQAALAEVQAAAVEVLHDRELAQQAAEDAQLAADQANATGRVFPDTASGLSGTLVGEYFSVPSSVDAEYLILYRNENPVAVEIKRNPSVSFLDEVISLTYANRAITNINVSTIQVLISNFNSGL